MDGSEGHNTQHTTQHTPFVCLFVFLGPLVIVIIYLCGNGEWMAIHIIKFHTGVLVIKHTNANAKKNFCPFFLSFLLASSPKLVDDDDDNFY